MARLRAAAGKGKPNNSVMRDNELIACRWVVRRLAGLSGWVPHDRDRQDFQPARLLAPKKPAWPAMGGGPVSSEHADGRIAAKLFWSSLKPSSESDISSRGNISQFLDEYQANSENTSLTLSIMAHVEWGAIMLS